MIISALAATAAAVVLLWVADAVPKPRIENKADLDEALDALRTAVTETLDTVEAVE